MLILASASPRRRELLTQAGFQFQIHPAHIPEDPLPNEEPIAYVTRLARQKAEAVFAHLTTNAGAPGLADRGPQRQVLVGGVAETWETAIYDLRSLVVLGADTTVTLDTHILGKPESAEDAARMLRLLSGRTHRVVTGVALVSATRQQVAAEVTAVQFLTLSERDIQAYIATGEPTDKAGAYAIQGRAARWIPRIEGCYFNVVGLPIALVSTLLEAHSDFSL
jgi:septum formation protein